MRREDRLAASGRPAGPVSRGRGLAFLPPPQDGAWTPCPRAAASGAARSPSLGPRPLLSSWGGCGSSGDGSAPREGRGSGWTCCPGRRRSSPEPSSSGRAGNTGCPRSGMEGALAPVGPATALLRPCSALGFCFPSDPVGHYSLRRKGDWGARALKSPLPGNPNLLPRPGIGAEDR